MAISLRTDSAVGSEIGTRQSSSVTRSVPIDDRALATARIERAMQDARAKCLPHPPTVRENESLSELRSQIARLLARAFATDRPHEIAAAMRVTRTLVVRWCDARWSDKRPAPLALLLAIDDQQFDRVVSMLREVRARREMGR